jgi:nucleoside-diphosphate-sugar epimerase
LEKYLVTGGAGFIGSHLVEALVSQGAFVRVLDNFDTGSPENLRGLPGRLEVVEGSVENLQMVREAMAGIDYVLHQAARASVPRSIEDPFGTHNVNITGTLNVLKAAKDLGIRRVVCASSSSVYGETPELPKVETMLPSPKSPYALSKLALEHYCSIFFHVYGLETVSLRYFNIYGSRQNPNLQYAAVVPIFIKNMLKKKPCHIYGDGGQTRDFTFIQDCIEANLLACKAPNVGGEVFNIACGRPTSVNQLFELLSKILGNTVPPVFEPSRPGDVLYSYADIQKVSRALDFQPRFSLEKGLQQTVEWYRKENMAAAPLPSSE